MNLTNDNHMNNSSNALPSGTVLNSGSSRYVITDVIAQGGFGITYRATTQVMVGNIAAPVTVAIKEFFIAADCERTRIAGSSDTTMVTSGPARERVEAAKSDFIAEARRLNALSGQCPNIVSVNEVFQANGTVYYVMEYLEGPSLRDYVNARHRLSESETLRLMAPILNAVEFLHAHRIMHLDIKPANIVVCTGDGGRLRPVLIDFGQSKHYNNSDVATRTVAAAGLTDGYAPIEQYSGITRFSPETDVYALAATMLFCLSGHKPPRAMDIDAINLGSLYPADVSANTSQALSAALVMNPAGRTSSVRDFASALYRQSTPATDVNPSGRRHWILWSVIAILLIVIVVLAVKLTDGRGDTPIAPDIDEYVPADTVAIPDDAAPEATDEEAVADTVPIVEEPRSGTAPPVMHTYNYSGYFIDSSGQRWPVKLIANTDGEGRWGKCVYTNVTYGIDLNMQGSGSGDNYTFYTNESGADLTIRISGGGEGVWEGTATSGSKTLSVLLYE